MVIRNRNKATKCDISDVSNTLTKYNISEEPTIVIKHDLSKLLKEVIEFPVIDKAMVKQMKPKFRERYSILQGLDYKKDIKGQYEDLYQECLNYLERLKVTVGMTIQEEHYNIMSDRMTEKYKPLKGRCYHIQIKKDEKLLKLYRLCVNYIRGRVTYKNYYETNKEKIQDKYRQVYRARKRITETQDPTSS